jgi:ribosome biogenesis GTPase
LIVFNKLDIYDEKALIKLSELEIAYNKAGYDTLRTSVSENIGIDKFVEKIQGKTVLVSGNSGAGKSTLINELIPDLGLKTGSISKSHSTGKHTTTFAEMFDMNPHTQIIDTPGIKGFGLVDFENDELARYFPEMLNLLGECKFHNCRHLNEPGCSVIKSLENGEFSKTRYNSYVAMYNQDDESSYRQNNYS